MATGGTEILNADVVVTLILFCPPIPAFLLLVPGLLEFPGFSPYIGGSRSRKQQQQQQQVGAGET